MSNCKRDCRCVICSKTDEKLNSLRPKRHLPQHVLEQIRAKSFKREQEDLAQGIMLVECPRCHHSVRIKVGPMFSCTACGSVVT